MPLMRHGGREVDHESPDHENVIPGEWREAGDFHLLQGLAPTQQRNPTNRAKAMRNYLAEYYTSAVGAVPWQERIVYPLARV